MEKKIKDLTEDEIKAIHESHIHVSCRYCRLRPICLKFVDLGTVRLIRSVANAKLQRLVEKNIEVPGKEAK
jgi:hypothetical protein